MLCSRFFLKPPQKPLGSPLVSPVNPSAPQSVSFPLASAFLNGALLVSREIALHKNEIFLFADNMRIDIRNLYASLLGARVVLETDNFAIVLNFDNELVGSGFLYNAERWVVQSDFANIYFEEGVVDTGNFAHVFKAKRRFGDPNVSFAVKRILKSSIEDEKALRYLDSELNVLRLLSQKNVINIVSVFDDDTSIKLVTEFVPGGSLANILKSRCLTEPELLSVMFGLLSALGELKKHNLIHRDLKPQNVLFDQRGEAKLIDFGLCADHSDQSSTSFLHDRSGTVCYIAPEILNNNQPSTFYDHSVDLYSLGIIAYESLTGKNPFRSHTYDTSIRLNQAGFIDYSLLACSNDLSALIIRLTSKHPKTRASLEEALSETMRLMSLAAKSQFVAECHQSLPQPIHMIDAAPQLFLPEVKNVVLEIAFAPTQMVRTSLVLQPAPVVFVQPRLARFSGVDRVSLKPARLSQLQPAKRRFDENFKENNPFFVN